MVHITKTTHRAVLDLNLTRMSKKQFKEEASLS